MIGRNFKRLLDEGIMTILPERHEVGFNHTYTIIPSGLISCDTNVLYEISNRAFKDGNQSGFLEIEISRAEKLINFHAHAIFYNKNKSKTPSKTYEEDRFSQIYANNKRKSKEHLLFLFQQYNLKPEINCTSFLQDLERTDTCSSYDMQNKNVYQQIGVSIIHNTKELIIVFHDSYKNIKIYKTESWKRHLS